MSLSMDSRLPLPNPAGFDSEQQAIYDSILASRGDLSGPFLAWMHSPRFASLAEKLGAFCRYHTELELIESELLILCVARHFSCVGEQQIHEPIAESAGLPREQIDALREGRPVQFENVRLQLLYDAARSLLGTNRLPQPLYEALVAQFGVPCVVEIVGVIGYYSLVAMTLNAFEMRKASTLG